MRRQQPLSRIVPTREYTTIRLQLTRSRQSSLVILYFDPSTPLFATSLFFFPLLLYLTPLYEKSAWFLFDSNLSTLQLSCRSFLIVLSFLISSQPVAEISPNPTTDRLFFPAVQSIHTEKYRSAESADRTRSFLQAYPIVRSSRYCNRGSKNRHITTRTLPVERFKGYTGRMFAKRAHG